MSDAMTNSEIEDLLTSVRRLVAEDVRRTTGADEGSSQGGRLILTQAQRVDSDSTAALDTATSRPEVPARSSLDPRPAFEPPKPAAPEAPLMQAPDFRRLEATIAELEAAVSASGSVFEPDGSETASNVTALYAKPSFLHAAAARAAESPLPDSGRTTQEPEAKAASTAHVATDEAAADERDHDEEMFETVIDEATLRILVAQIVREELQGQLGERITLQVRKLVRGEIAKALDSRNLI